ncbi:MAG: hypothetical protein ACRD3L_08955 [Terriglobales bacterium]
MKCTLLYLAGALCLTVATCGFGQAGAQEPGRKPVVYVMPNALANPGPSEGSQVVVDSARNDKEPQVAKTYQELQHRAECKEFAANMIKDKADYFLLLQHGGGKGNRWALSDKQGDVFASGESFTLGASVKDACQAIAKDWQKRRGVAGGN